MLLGFLFVSKEHVDDFFVEMAKMVIPPVRSIYSCC